MTVNFGSYTAQQAVTRAPIVSGPAPVVQQSVQPPVVNIAPVQYAHRPSRGNIFGDEDDTRRPLSGNIWRQRYDGRRVDLDNYLAQFDGMMMRKVLSLWLIWRDLQPA